jgi:hypothetical protein
MSDNMEILPATPAQPTQQRAGDDDWTRAKAEWLDAPIKDPKTPATASTLRGLWIAAQMLNSSGIFKTGFGDTLRPITDREALVLCLMGARLGLDPLASLMGFDLIEGRPAARVATLHAIVMASGTAKRLERTECTSERATWVGARVTVSGTVIEQSVTFTIEDAKNGDLLSRKNWRRWAPDMLSARALSRLLRMLWPEILAGMTSVEEASDGAQEDEGERVRRMVAQTTPSAEVVEPPPEPRRADGPPLEPAAVPQPEVRQVEAPRGSTWSMFGDETAAPAAAPATPTVGVRRARRGGDR